MMKTQWMLRGWKALAVAGTLLAAAACVDDGGEDGDGSDNSGIAVVQDLRVGVTPDFYVFDTVTLGQTISTTFTVENLSPGGAAVTVRSYELIGNGTNDFDVVCGKAVPFELNVGAPVTCTLNFTPSISEGQSGSIDFETNAGNDATASTFTFETPALEPAISVDPPELSFQAREGQEQTKTVRVRNTGAFPLQITGYSVQGQPDIFPARHDEGVYGSISQGSPLILNPYREDINPGDSGYRSNELTIDVTYAPETTGSDEAQLVLISDDPQTPSLAVDLRGSSNSPCILVLDGTNIDFGNSLIGGVNEYTVSIQNCGNADLEISQVEPGENSGVIGDASSVAPFIIDTGLSHPADSTGVMDPPIIITPGETNSFILGYAPTAEQPDTGTAYILSNDDANPRVELSLFGRGVNNECPTTVAEATVRGESVPPSTQIQAAPLQYLIIDANDSFDNDGSIVDYEWEIIARPDGSSVDLEPVSGEVSDSGRRQLFLDLAGRFEIEVRAVDDGGCISEVAEKITVLVVPDEAVHVQLVWNNPQDPDQTDISGSDVDLHFMKIPDGRWFQAPYDNYFGNREPFWSSEHPSLDIDDTNGAGPENINLDDPLPCQWYAVAVHYWREQFGTAYTTLRIFINGQMVFEYLNKPLVQTNDWWDVARIHWPSGEVIMVDTMGTRPQGNNVPAPITDGMVESGLCGVPGE